MGLAEAIITDQDARTISSAHGGAKLGQRASTSDGRVYAYGSAGGADLAAGKLCINTDNVSNDTNRAPGANVAIGATSLTVVAGASVAANKYAEGYLTVNAGTGAGYSYKVVGNTVGTTTTVTLEDPVQVALVASADSKVSLTYNPYSLLLISDVDALDFPAGVPNVVVTTLYYAWIQCGGECAVLSDASAPVPGAEVVASDDTAGAVGIYETDVSTILQAPVGVAIQAGVSAEYRPVFLTIAF